jgi:tetratricopeptide (TPR) repeat protein
MSMQPGTSENEMIKAHMRALADFDEICSDPYLEETRAYVSSIVAETESMEAASNRKFIQDALSGKSVSAEDFKDISIEIRQSDIDLLSVEWVNEWHRKKHAQASLSQADEERKNFISDSLNETDTSEKTPGPKIIPYRRFAYMAAAAVIGIIFLFSALKPSPSPDQLFNKYYESFSAMTSVTRGNNASDQLSYERGIDYYKAGKYSEAAAAFRAILHENNASLFYLGLSELENGNTDQAISALELSAEKQGSYYKETTWYLGLAWLKKGNKAEAAKYLGTLAGTEGFYGKRADKILRRLK